MNRKRALRTLGRISIGLALVTAAAGVFVTVRTNARMAARYDVPVDSLTIDDTAEARARGEHLVKSLAKCVDCHGDDLGGKVMADDPMIGTLAGPNLTSAGIGKKANDCDTTDAKRFSNVVLGHLFDVIHPRSACSQPACTVFGSHTFRSDDEVRCFRIFLCLPAGLFQCLYSNPLLPKKFETA